MKEIFDLRGRVAMITGGNGGIGLGMARGLVRAGCIVSIWGRFGEPDDFAGIAVYLMSRASAFHTADTLVIDGGHSAY